VRRRQPPPRRRRGRYHAYHEESATNRSAGLPFLYLPPRLLFETQVPLRGKVPLPNWHRKRRPHKTYLASVYVVPRATPLDLILFSATSFLSGSARSPVASLVAAEICSER